VDNKACIFCKWFYLDPGEAPYSKWTPGEDASLGCTKNVWTLYGDWTEKDWRLGMAEAQNCDLYEYIPLSEIGG